MSEKAEDLMLSSPSQVPDSLGINRNVAEESPGSREPSSSDNEVEPITSKARKRTTNFSGSESDLDKEIEGVQDSITSPSKSDDVSDNGSSSFNNHTNIHKKSRIKHFDTSDSDDSSMEEKKAQKKSARTENKLKKLKDKFKRLASYQINSREETALDMKSKPKSDSEGRENSDEEVSCLKIKQNIKKSAQTLYSICDPDTSDEENNTKTVNKQKSKPKPKKTKPTSPKPMRMTTKQAMENMHKIKSESNRMLREKEVSLPYHRPKALLLKDIMSRRKPAVAPDGKALPIKMNSEQLRQYALLLEERQKEVIELCKSDTDEEDDCSGPEDDTNSKNIISTVITNNINTEPGFQEPNTNASIENANTNESIGEANTNETLENLNENKSLGETTTKKGLIKGNNTDETSCIQSFDQGNIEMNVDKQTESLKETESVNINLDTEYKNTEVNNSLKNNKEPDKIIELKEISENLIVNVSEPNTVKDSQNIELHYDTEKVEIYEEHTTSKGNNFEDFTNHAEEKQPTEIHDDDEFLDNDFNYDEIDKLIENAKIACDEVQKSNFSNPKLTGAPGMVIDLENLDSFAPKQLSGVDLLKERFTFFAKLKSLEEQEKDREKKFKPGLQHLKLKQELEEQIAEQRSLEWEKRLDEEKRLKSEMNGNHSDDDIETLEAKLEEDTEKPDDEKCDKEKAENESSEGEEEPLENDVILEDKLSKRNPMVDDEAEESECDNGDDDVDMKDEDDGDEADLEDDDDETSDSSSESEEEVDSKPRKGRILKAFEDSDDESPGVQSAPSKKVHSEISQNLVNVGVSKKLEDTELVKDSQDDELQLAQANKSSDDLFSTQDSDKPNLVVAALTKNTEDNVSADLGTQTFSILDSVTNKTVDFTSQENTPVFRTQTVDNDLNLLVGVEKLADDHRIKNALPQFSQTQEMGDEVVALCTGKFYDNPFVSQDKLEGTTSSAQLPEGSQSQEFGDDIAALCTGKFYDNPMVSQYGAHSKNYTETLEPAQNPNVKHSTSNDKDNSKHEEDINPINIEKTVLSSILEELDGPDFVKPKNKYFPSGDQSKDRSKTVGQTQFKKKLIIDSDDETSDSTTLKKNKKVKKRKLEDRALQISDDEDDEEEEEIEEDQTDVESEINEDEERVVEYDSEENEVEVQQKTSKTKRMGAFFENEAELTSEDEWVGSGDEDERGLDRMEREEGDDDTFHQGQLQKELGQIHLREVLDQDKREVRMIQELLFEDGDLGDGHRQRKFRWKNADGEEETGTNPDEFLDTQEEEFESEEQWRKQRHEREMFLRKLQEKDDENLDTSISRTAIIKANLCSKNMSETKESKTEKENDVTVTDKKTTKDIPSPKKSFTIFQQNYHGSLLTRGRGALARLAALATPLATDDDDTPKVVTTANRRNFVFAALSQDEQPKVPKRKADTNVNTPRLVKKMKTEDQNKHYKSSLFDLLKS